MGICSFERCSLSRNYAADSEVSECYAFSQPNREFDRALGWHVGDHLKVVPRDGPQVAKRHRSLCRARCPSLRLSNQCLLSKLLDKRKSARALREDLHTSCNTNKANEIQAVH